MPEIATDLSIVPVSPSDDVALRAWFDVMSQVRAHDLPEDPPLCWVDVKGRLADGRVGLEVSAWLAYCEGVAVGSVMTVLPTLDNLDNMIVDGVVVPSWRRRGIGTRLLAHTADVARRAGRTRLLIEAQQPLDASGPGAEFLAATGARLGIADRRRRLDLMALDQGELDRLAAEARAAAGDYELVQWRGPTPEDRLADVARLAAAMSTDAPQEDLHVEGEVWDAERMRGRDASMDARGLHRAVTAAAGPDGGLVAYTMLLGCASVDWFAWQSDTIVLSEHRGHRLGLLLKLANLALARAEHPALRVVDTYNADSNTHMVAINEAMGFRPLDRLGEWELDL